MRGTAVLLISLMFLSCLGPSWVARPVPEKDYYRCDPFKEMPQMITVPGYPSVWQVVHSCQEYPREKTAIALKIFRFYWESIIGNPASVDAIYEDLLISWQRNSSEGYSGFGVDGIYYENVSLKGVTLSPETVMIFNPDHGPDRHDRICESALVHELVHAVIWKANGVHGDPDHLGQKYDGWTVDHMLVIQETNNHLCILGI